MVNILKCLIQCLVQRDKPYFLNIISISDILTVNTKTIPSINYLDLSHIHIHIDIHLGQLSGSCHI